MNLPTYITGTAQTRAYALLRENVVGVLRQYDVTPTHWSMIGIILEARDGVRQSEIARAMNVKPPLITVMVRELENRGILQSVKNQFDSRAKLISVTPKGKKIVKAVEAALRKDLSRLLIGLTENDLLTYHKVLTTIITNGSHIKKTGV
jgi:MarR family transcriptional regulator for hemolysin